MISRGIGISRPGNFCSIPNLSAAIAVRSGAHCAPLMHETLGTKMQGAVRISVSHKNTEEEIDRTAKAIKKLSQLLE